MTTEIERVIVKIQGDVSDLKKALDQATRETQKTTGIISTLWGNKVKLAFGAAVVAAGLFVKEQYKIIDANQKVATSLGISYKSLQNISLVAKEAGIEAGQLNMAFTALQNNLFAAAQGSEQQEKAFRNLGLSIGELLKLSPDKQFEEMARAIAKIENPTVRVGVATDIFGRNARALLNVFDDYARKLAEAEAFNKKFGLSLDRIDTAKIEQANDAFGRIKMALSGYAQQIAVGLAPVIEGISNAFTDMLPSVEGWGDAIRRAVQEVAFWLDSLKEVIDTVTMAWKTASNTLVTGLTARYAQLTGQKDLVPYIIGEGMTQTKNSFKEYQDRNKTAFQDFVNKSYASSQNKAQNTAAREAAAMDGTTISVNFKPNGLDDFIRDIKDLQKNLADLSVKGLKTLEDSLVDIVSGTKSASEAFKDMANSILNDILRLVIRQTIIEPIASSLTGAVRESTSTGGFFGNILGNIFGGFRASGGPVSQGNAYMVGENGPEMFVPGRSGSIVPNGALGGGGGVNVNIFNNAGTEVQTRTSRSADGSLSLDVIIDTAMANKLMDPRSRTASALRRGYAINPILAGR